MSEAFHLGGWGMYPTSIAGSSSSSVRGGSRGRHRASGCRSCLSLGALVGLTSTLGFVAGVIKTLLAAGQLPPNDAFGTVIIGIGESANNLGLGLSNSACCRRSARRRSRAAASTGGAARRSALTHSSITAIAIAISAERDQRGPTARRAAAPVRAPDAACLRTGPSRPAARRPAKPSALHRARSRAGGRDDAAALLQLVRIAHALEDLADVAIAGRSTGFFASILQHESSDLVGMSGTSTTARPASALRGRRTSRNRRALKRRLAGEELRTRCSRASRYRTAAGIVGVGAPARADVERRADDDAGRASRSTGVVRASFAMPKSSSFTSGGSSPISTRNTFSGLRSRWTMPCRARPRARGRAARDCAPRRAPTGARTISRSVSPFEQLHHEVTPAVGVAEPEDVDDAGWPIRLTARASAMKRSTRWVARTARAFSTLIAARLPIIGWTSAKDDAHPALADHALDAILAEDRAGLEQVLGGRVYAGVARLGTRPRCSRARLALRRSPSVADVALGTSPDQRRRHPLIRLHPRPLSHPDGTGAAS